MYDWLVVGAGPFGATFAREMTDRGKKVLVLDKRSKAGGNCADELVEGLWSPKYGGHIFHTYNREIWEYVNRYSLFTSYKHQVIVNTLGKLFSFPINLLTLNQLWGVSTPSEAIEALRSRQVSISNPQNFEEKALSLVGEEIYETFFKYYTEKQWGRPCTEVPSYILNRIPIRFSYDGNYFGNQYQGMPTHGFSTLFSNMLQGIEVIQGEYKLNDTYPCERVLYTGELDKLFNYTQGKLGYRSLEFVYETGDEGAATVNYSGNNVPYTRKLFPKYFYDKITPNISITEYLKATGEPYYPVGTAEDNKLHSEYLKMVPDHMVIGGRLGDYKYRDIDITIKAALQLVEKVK